MMRATPNPTIGGVVHAEARRGLVVQMQGALPLALALEI